MWEIVDMDISGQYNVTSWLEEGNCGDGDILADIPEY